jgi:hypothetical protein
MTKPTVEALRKELESLEAEQTALPASERDPAKIERAHALHAALRKAPRSPAIASDGMGSVSMLIHVPSGLHEAFKRECKRRGVTMAGQIRELIRGFVE